MFHKEKVSVRKGHSDGTTGVASLNRSWLPIPLRNETVMVENHRFITFNRRHPNERLCGGRTATGALPKSNPECKESVREASTVAFILCFTHHRFIAIIRVEQSRRTGQTPIIGIDSLVHGTLLRL